MFLRLFFAAIAVLSLMSFPAFASVKVVASIRPLHSLVAGVMEGVGAPDLIMSGGGSPHHYVMKPSSARMLQSADLVFWIGPALEGFLKGPLEKLAGKAEKISLADAPELKLYPIRSGHQGDHGDHHDLDMHIWLDPDNAVVMVNKIAEVLAKADPENANLYQQNGKTMVERLLAMSEELSTALNPVRKIQFMVYHDSFQYLEKRYQLNVLDTGISGTENAPSAGKIARIRDEMKKKWHEMPVFGTAIQPKNR